MDSLVSVIVPVYKVEKYLSKCLDSIVNQTYKNLEIILVDDGSPDNSGKICDEYAQKDSRIKVIHKENGGLSSARNAGLDIATGEYIAFADSDDSVHLDFVEKLYRAIKEENADIACCSVEDFIEDKNKIECRGGGSSFIMTWAENPQMWFGTNFIKGIFLKHCALQMVECMKIGQYICTCLHKAKKWCLSPKRFTPTQLEAEA